MITTESRKEEENERNRLTKGQIYDLLIQLNQLKEKNG